MSYIVATLPKGYAVTFAANELDKVITANGCTQLNDMQHIEKIEDAIGEMNRRNEEIEQKRNSSLVIVSQGLHSIVNVNGDMNQVLASVTKFICETLSRGGFTFSQIDKMIDLLMQHMDNLAEQQAKTFNDLKEIVEEEDYEFYDDDESVE